MSRSFRHHPYLGNLMASSEKKDKAIWHRRLRARVRTALGSGREMPLINEVSEIWDMSKDGKTRFSARDRPDWMRR